MPRYLDTRGNTSVAIAVCDRCKRKRAIVDLKSDEDSPGLQVCREGYECCDHRDPYRLAPRRSEDISLRRPRPDEPLTS